MTKPYIGPTVVEASEARIREINQQIYDLTFERIILQRRVKEFKGSTMLESERRATSAEPFQTTQLPECRCGLDPAEYCHYHDVTRLASHAASK